MKKNLFAVLMLVLVLFCCVAFAETALQSQTVSEKIALWEHDVVVVDQKEQSTSYPLVVTLEPKAPVELTVLPVAENLSSEVFVCKVTREGVGDVMIAVSPANRGLHYNLNDYTQEMLDEYIRSVVEGNYAEGTYTAEVLTSEGGNTFVRVGTEYQETLSTIYDDFTMEFQLTHLSEENTLEPLTEEDHAFAIEIFQSVWTEDAEIPDMDTEITINVNNKVLTDLGVENADSIADVLNKVTFLLHGQDDLLHFAVKSDENEVVNLDVTVQDDGVLLQSNVLEDKGIFFSKAVIEQAAKSAASRDASDLPTALPVIRFEKTMAAAADAVVLDANDDGAMTLTISAEAAARVLDSISEDLKNSEDLVRLPALFGLGDMDKDTIEMIVDLAIDSVKDMLPDENLVYLALTTDESGNLSAEGKITYNTVEYNYDAATEDFTTSKIPNVISLTATMSSDNDATNIRALCVMEATDAQPAAGIRFVASLENDGEFNVELAGGNAVDSDIVPAFTLTAENTQAPDELGSLQMLRFALNIADDTGKLQEAFSLVNLFTGVGKDNIQAFIVNMAGYEDPVAVVRTRDVFSETITVPAPAEIIPSEEIDEKLFNELMGTVSEKLMSLSGRTQE